jgi:hypothetical protein
MRLLFKFLSISKGNIYFIVLIDFNNGLVPKEDQAMLHIAVYHSFAKAAKARKLWVQVWHRK